MAVLGVLDVVADDANRVRDLLAQVEEELLAHELCHKVLGCGVRVHVVREPLGPFGQVSRDKLHECVDVEALARRDDQLVIEVGKLARSAKLGGDLLGRRLVRLGDHQELEVCLGAVDVARNPGVTRANRLGRVDEKGNHVSIGELGQGSLVELLAKAVLGLVETRRVDDNELRVGRVHHGTQTLARGLRHGARDGNLLAHAGVDQRRLAHVGPADKCHEAAPEGRVAVVVVFHVLLLNETKGVSLCLILEKDCVCKDDDAHQSDEYREHPHCRRRNVLCPARKRVELGRHQVDHSLDGGVEKLRRDDHPTAHEHDRPAQGVKAHHKASNDGANAATNHHLDVSLGAHRRPKALDGKEEALAKRRVVVVRPGNHSSTPSRCLVSVTGRVAPSCGSRASRASSRASMTSASSSSRWS